MTTYISVLRGINVGGHRMIKMDALRKMCSELGFSDVRTYIQSGNIVFKTKQLDTGHISETIKNAIEKEFGFDVPVITLTQEELEMIINNNPFLKDRSMDPSFLHVAFLSAEPLVQDVERLAKTDLKNDRFAIKGKAIYLYCPDGVSNSKLTNSLIENKLKVTATARNWKTTNELLSIAAQ